MINRDVAIDLLQKLSDLIAFGGLAILIDRFAPVSFVANVSGLIFALVVSLLCSIARFPADFSHREPSHD